MSRPSDADSPRGRHVRPRSSRGTAQARPQPAGPRRAMRIEHPIHQRTRTGSEGSDTHDDPAASGGAWLPGAGSRWSVRHGGASVISLSARHVLTEHLHSSLPTTDEIPLSTMPQSFAAQRLVLMGPPFRGRTAARGKWFATRLPRRVRIGSISRVNFYAPDTHACFILRKVTGKSLG